MAMRQTKQTNFSPPSPNKGIRSPIKRAFFPKDSFFLEDSPGSPKSSKSPYNVEEELKKQFLNNFLIEENPVEACKQYLDILIKKKLGENQIDKVNEKDFIKNLVEKMKTIQNDKPNFLQDEIQTYLDEENKYLNEIRKKNEKIILTSKKLKNRMKLQKVDKEMKFQKSTKKNFGSLNTFIDASEFLQEINPFKEKNNPQFTDLRLSASLKKLKGKALNYFDSQINTFMERLSEETGNYLEKDENSKAIFKKSRIERISQLERRHKTELNIKNADPKNSTNIETKRNSTDESSEEEAAIPLVQNPSKIDPKKSTAMEFYQDLERKKSMFKYLTRNSLFLEKNYENQPLLKLLKEFSNPNSLLKRKKNDEEELKKTRFQQKLIRGLIKSDDQLTQFDFQAENKNFVDNDGFYENLLDHFSKEEYYGIKQKEKKETNSQKTIESLEKYVNRLTNNKDEEEEGKEIQVIERKYNEFRNKSKAVLRLVSNASKLILNKQNSNNKISVRDKKLVEIKENTQKRLSMFSGEIQNNQDMKKLSLFNHVHNHVSLHSEVPENNNNKIQITRTSISKLPFKYENDSKIQKEASLTERTEKTPRLDTNKYQKISVITRNFEEDANRTVFLTPVTNRKTISNIDAIKNLPKNENYFNIEKERSTTNSKIEKTTIPPNSEENRTFLISHKRVNSDLLNKSNYKKAHGDGGICSETFKNIDSIINRAENLKIFYGGEKLYLEKMENDSNLFYNEQKKKLNSNLESLSMTLEKCSTKLKFTKLKKPNLSRFKRKKIMEQLI